jgi:wyosine [tRNA(Phe)-imidazoG37] synthetase (radical SAM superfamily)
MKHKHLFGPVPSRRLGVSLGVDLIPLKTCSLDCVYCECGKTTRLTVERKEYIPVDRVIAELEVYLRNNPPLDFITFAGFGEPNLNSGLGNVISYLKQNFRQYRTCLLTNGTLFTDPEVRAEAAAVDLIIPSLDAATEDTFNRLNRPEISLDCTAIINGLEQLRSEYKGEIILEIFIVPGLNDTELELENIKCAIERIKPDGVQIGTLDRPGTEDWVEAADKDRLVEIAKFLGNADLIGNFKQRSKIASFKESHSRKILNTLRRRPCTAADLEQMLNLHPAELQKYINHLLETDRIDVDYKQRGAFFKIKTPARRG